MMAQNYVARLPSELFERIVVAVLVTDDTVAFTEQSAASMALVSRDWKGVMDAVGWDALILKRLGRSISCEPEDALWLIRMLRQHKRDTLTVTEAKVSFKLTANDLKPHREEARKEEGSPGRRYDLALLVDVAIARHGGVPGFRSHISKCQIRAAAGLRAAIAREHARELEVEEMLKAFDPRVPQYLDTYDYVKKKLGTLGGYRMEAAHIQERLEEADVTARLVGLEPGQIRFCPAIMRKFVSGVTDTLSLACLFKRLMEVQALQLDQVGPLDHSYEIKRYVEEGGELSVLVRTILGSTATNRVAELSRRLICPPEKILE